jgi:pimeloyl-ACP methyl ester carboxylesterase
VSTTIKTINTSVLCIAYLEYGSASGWPCIMGHGFPYDAHAYDQAAPILAQAGARVIVPYLRGYGPTRFLKAETPRSGEQAALGVDLFDFMDALKIERAVLGGYDWGGRAACILAALLPGRVVALVSGNSYNIQSIAYAMEPASPTQEAAFWYQYYFHSERGRRGLTKNRREIARLLWRMWSPIWAFDDATFDRTGSAFDNPDFVAVVIHSYRHRYGLAPGAGDPRYDEIEMGLAAQPRIAVPAITIDGDADGVNPARPITRKTSRARMCIAYSRAPATTCRRNGRRNGRGRSSTRGAWRKARERKGSSAVTLAWKGIRDWRSQTIRTWVRSSGLTARSLPTFSVLA